MDNNNLFDTDLEERVVRLAKPLKKGIMTVEAARKAQAAGAAGIVVSNHGGRVLDQGPASAEVLLTSGLRISCLCFFISSGYLLF